MSGNNTENVYNISDLTNDTYYVDEYVWENGEYVLRRIEKHLDPIGSSIWEPATKYQDNVFTNPYLYRRSEPKIPANDSELLPRHYSASIRGLNSYMTIVDFSNMDYQEFEQFLSDSSQLTEQEKEELRRRFEIYESKEIP